MMMMLFERRKLGPTFNVAFEEFRAQIARDNRAGVSLDET